MMARHIVERTVKIHQKQKSYYRSFHSQKNLKSSFNFNIGDKKVHQKQLKTAAHVKIICIIKLCNFFKCKLNKQYPICPINCALNNKQDPLCSNLMHYLKIGFRLFK